MKRVIIILTFFISINLNAQDLVYSQVFGSPLYLNPAFAGNLAKSSFYLNARQQWPSISGSYVSSSFSANHRQDNINSGIGLLVKQDEQGSANLKATQLSAIYSYIIHINKKWSVTPALEVSYLNSRFDQSTFVFGDQINEDFSISKSVNENLSFNNISSLDISSGIILYDKNFWVGFSSHHLTQPKYFIGNSSSLNRKYSFHSGYTYKYKTPSLREHLTFIPSININYQDPFTRVNISFSTTYHYFSIGTGIANITSSFANQNILNSFLLFGYSDEHFKVGYSYDFTIRGATGLGGAHEISMGIWLNYDNNSYRKPLKHKKIRKVSCPKF